MLLQNERGVELTSRPGTGGGGRGVTMALYGFWIHGGVCCGSVRAPDQTGMTSLESGVLLRPHVLTPGGQTVRAVVYRAFLRVLIGSEHWVGMCWLALVFAGLGQGSKPPPQWRNANVSNRRPSPLTYLSTPRRGDRLRDRQTRLAVTSSSSGGGNPICNLNMVTMRRRQRSGSVTA